MEKIFNFFKKRSLVQKAIIGVSGLIFIVGIGIITISGSEVPVYTEKVQEEVVEEDVVKKEVDIIAPAVVEIEEEAIVVEEVIEEEVKGESIEKVENISGSDIDGIKSEFEEVYSGNEVNISLGGSILNVTVIEAEDHPLVEADEMAISNYTDWTLENMKDDIESIDIKIERPSSSVRAKLNMSDMKTDNGRYFHLDDIIKGIQ